MQHISQKILNRDLAERSFQQRASVVSSYPTVIFVELTANCDLDCAVCPVKSNRNPALDMPFDLFQKIADEMFPQAMQVELRGYGETLVLPNLKDYLDYATRFDCQFSLLTNLNTQDRELLCCLMEKRFYIGVSFDGATAKTFEKLRQGSHFDRIIDNLSYLVTLRRELNRSAESLYLLVTVQPGNLQELGGVVRLAHEIGINVVKFSPVHLVWKTTKKGTYADLMRKMSEAIIVAEREAEELGVKVELKGELNKQKCRTECASPWLVAYITRKGDVMACKMLKAFQLWDYSTTDTGFIYGNMKGSTFREIWNNEHFQRFRREFYTESRLKECSICLSEGRSYSYVNEQRTFC